MTFYRKKPVIVEAVQFVYSAKGIDELSKFAGNAIGNISKYRHPTAKAQAEIKTLEDGSVNMTVTHIATEGDFIIKGVNGEFYACKEDIFHATYEKAYASDL